MKSFLLSILMLFTVSIAMYGQREITKFLGIPVDGNKSEMIRKLKEKGFKSDPLIADALIGEFNGAKVNVYVVTNDDKVCRIVINDVNLQSAGDIRLRFNRLCRQFLNNKRYIPATLFEDYTIPEGEDISYEITVNDKRYEAVYYQMSVELDSAVITKEMRPILLKKYTAEQLANPTEELKKEVLETSITHMYDIWSKNPVWFIISELYGKYYITMFYDNEYNRANGEDL